MANGITVKLEGFDDILRKLNTMDQKITKELRQAGKAGAEVIQDEAKAKAPGPEIGMHVEKATQHLIEIAIGPLKEKWFYRFFETGARKHEIKASKADVLSIPGVGREFYAQAENTGGVNAQPFLRPALDGKSDEATDTLGAVLWKALQELTR